MVSSGAHACSLRLLAVVAILIYTLFYAGSHENDVQDNTRSNRICRVLTSWIDKTTIRIEHAIRKWETRSKVRKRIKLAKAPIKSRLRNPMMAILAFSAVAMSAQAASFDHDNPFDSDSRPCGIGRQQSISMHVR